MKAKIPEATPSRLQRELERERHERLMNDEAKAGLGPADRVKDARETSSSTGLKRSHGR